MNALLLAAGLGTRLRPITDTVPKCLVPINGTPLLDIWFDLLLSGGVERILVNTHHHADKVQAHVEASEWRGRVDTVHEPELLGTGGAILRNRDYFEDDTFLVAHADNLTRFDLRAFTDRHESRPRGVIASMMTFKTDEPQACGIVELDGRGIVCGFHEKVADPPGTCANAAVYIFDPAVIDLIAAMGDSFVDLSTEILPRLVGRMWAFANRDYHRDIGSPASLRLAQQEFRAYAGKAARR